jgi:hypothetical protein
MSAGTTVAVQCGEAKHLMLNVHGVLGALRRPGMIHGTTMEDGKARGFLPSVSR